MGTIDAVRFARMIQSVEAHAAGEHGRVIVGGVLDVPGVTMFDKMQWLSTEGDALSRLPTFARVGGHDPSGRARTTKRRRAIAHETGQRDRAETVEGTRRAFDSMPSFDVSVSMKTAYHKDPSHRWNPNGIHDIDALASNLPSARIRVLFVRARRPPGAPEQQRLGWLLRAVPAADAPQRSAGWLDGGHVRP